MLGLSHEIGHGVDAQVEGHAALVPAVKLPRLGEIAVPAEHDAAEARLPHQGDRLVDPVHGVVMAGAVARPVDDEERLLGVGQGHQERMVAPHPLVRQIHALLALPGGGHDAAIHVEDGLVEKRLGLLSPHLEPLAVEQTQQSFDVALAEAVQEISGGGRVGDAASVERVKIVLVVPQQLDILKHRATGQEVIGHIEHVVRLEVRQMPLEHVEFFVDGAGQPQTLGHQVDGADAATGQAMDFVRQLIVDVTCSEHRCGLFHPGLRPEPPLDTALAIAETIL
jgi:hypothetical protein